MEDESLRLHLTCIPSWIRASRLWVVLEKPLLHGMFESISALSHTQQHVTLAGHFKA